MKTFGSLKLKSIDDEKRIVVGTATTPEIDSVGDTVAPLGAEYRLPIVLLWQHDSSAPIGEVYEAKPSHTGITVKARIFKAQESPTLRERLDSAWESVKLGLVRGFSIGFSPLSAPEPTASGGYHFALWHWHELSLVTIPANESATAFAVKHVVVRLTDRERLAVPARRRSTVVYLDR